MLSFDRRPEVPSKSVELEAGFTLIEMLIVVVILGILAATVTFAVQDLTRSSASATCQSDYKTVESAAEFYKDQMYRYPGASHNGIQDLITAATDPVSGEQVGPWLKDTPGDSEYQFVVGTSNLPGAAGSSAVNEWGTGSPKSITAGDGEIWVGTPGNGAAQWTSGTGATVVNGTGGWVASGSISGPGTAETACSSV